MCWQCIAEGANGLVLYTFNAYEEPKGKYDVDERWAITCRVAGEIRDRMPLLLSDPAETPVVRGCSDVSVRAWRQDGETKVLLVNTTEEPRHAAVTVGGRALEADLAPLEVVFR